MPARLSLAAGDQSWTLEVDDTSVRIVETGLAIDIAREADGRFRTSSGPKTLRGTALRHGDDVWVAVDGRLFVFTVNRRRPGHERAVERDALTVPMPATVVRVFARAGQPVRQGDLLVALEAMKMELAIRAPRDGVVRAVHCRDGELVPVGKVLVEL